MNRDRWAFALNGYVPAFRARHMRGLRAHLSDGHYARLEGVSDAETLFHLVLTSMASGEDPGRALIAVRDLVEARLGPAETAPLTMVLSGPEGITALHTTVNGAVNSLYLLERAGMAEGGVLLASERLDETDGWQRVPDHSLVRIRQGSTDVDPL